MKNLIILLSIFIFGSCNFNPKHHIVYYYGEYGEYNYYPDTFYVTNGNCLTIITKDEKNIICGTYIIDY